jgi:peptide/nickel transport system substrate-binding protein
MICSRFLRSSAAIILLLLSACSGKGSNPRELHYGLTLAPTGIDPHINMSSELGIPLASVYDTLVFRNPDGGFVPGLAGRWEVSADGLQYTFFLRRDVRFHDGTAFEAGAVKTNLERVLDPANKSQKARFMIDAVQTVTVVDDYTIRLELAEPFAPLLDSLSQVYLGMASPAALAKWGADYQFHQVGTGPFRFVEYIPGDHLTLERNPEYRWAPSIYRQATAQVDRIVFRIYADPATRAPALLSGEADVMGEVLPRDAADLEKNGQYTVYPIAIPGQPLQFFINTGFPPTDDPLVRQALLLAADRKTLVETVFGAYSPVATGPLTSATWGAVNVIPADAYNPEAARARLAQAGWEDSDGDGLLDKDSESLRLKVVFPPWGLSPQTAEMLEMQWKAAGMGVDLVQAPSFSALIDAQKGGSYNLISMNQAGTDPDLLRPFFRSDGQYNLSNVHSDLLDRLLEDAKRAQSEADRLAFYRQAQEEIAAQSLLLPVRDYVNLNVANNRVKDLHYSAQGWFPVLIDVSLE